MLNRRPWNVERGGLSAIYRPRSTFHGVKQEEGARKAP
jgi:hypothetical protein